MARRLLALVLALALAGAWDLRPAGRAAAATSWSAHVAAGSKGLALSQGLPSTPTGVSAACTGLLLSPTVKVSWSSVAKATSYAVYQSTTSSSSGFSQAASGVVALNWTTGTLGTGNYWYRVVAYIGSNWASSQSSSTTQITILLGVSCT
jgi:hypothetical protein